MNASLSRSAVIISIASAFLISAGTLAYYGGSAGLGAASGHETLDETVRAEEALKSVLRENPYDIEAWDELGDFYQSSGRLDEALHSYERAVEISNGDGDLQLKASMILIRLGRIDDAESKVKTVLARRPNSVGANRLMGWISVAESGKVMEITSRPDEAALGRASAYFMESLRIDDGDAEAYVGMGAVAKLRADNQEAIRYFGEALSRDSRSYWGWQLMGEALVAMGRDSEARTAFVKAAEYCEGRPDPFAELAELSRSEGRYSDAAGLMNKVGERGSFARGRDLEIAGDLGGAEKAYIETLLKNPEDEVALDRLERVRIKVYPAVDSGRMELAMRRIQSAERAERVKNAILAFHNYRRAIQLAPQYSEARLKMAKFLSREGAFSEAVRQLQRVEELTRSQNERLIASDLMEVITHQALTEMETVHEVSFGDLWDRPTSQLGQMIGNPEVIEEKIRWSVTPVPKPKLVIAVLPFDEPVRPYHAGVGEIAAEWLISALELFPGYELIPAGIAKAAVAREKASKRMELDPTTVGAVLNADIVIHGRIIEGAERMRIELKVVKVPSGPVIHAQTFTAGGSGALTKMIIEVSSEISAGLSLNGGILRRHSSDMVTVNLGRIFGIIEGDTIQVVQARREMLVPGLDWPSTQETVIGLGVVRSLTERYAEVAMIDGRDRVRAGDVIRRLRKRDTGAR